MRIGVQAMDVKSALKVAAARLGIEELKDKQKEAIMSFASGKDVFVALPTGYGKSLCYQVLPVLFDALRGHSTPTSVIIVVTPLTSIVKDQVSHLEDKQLPAVHVTSAVGESTEDAILEGKYRVVYFSPEQLLCRSKWREMLQSEVYQKNLVAFVVDEAHCVKQW